MCNTDQPLTGLDQHLDELVKAIAARPDDELRAWRDALRSMRSQFLANLQPHTPGLIDLLESTNYSEAMAKVVDDVLDLKAIKEGA